MAARMMQLPAERVLHGVVAVCLGLIVWIWSDLSGQVNMHAESISRLQAEAARVESNAVTRTELQQRIDKLDAKLDSIQASLLSLVINNNNREGSR